MSQPNEAPIRLSNGFVFHRPEARIREYCSIEVYRDIGFRGGYDDRQSVTGAVTPDDFEAANNLYANLTTLDRGRILGDPELPPKLAAVKDADLGELSDDEWESVKSVVRPLVAEFLSIPHVKLAKTMKLLHLKRPRLFPVLDSYVVRFITANDLEANPFSEEELLQIGLTSLETARTDISTNRAPFRELGSRLSDLPTPLTTVRMYDILCWTQEKWVNRGNTGAPRGTASLSLYQGANAPAPISPPSEDTASSNTRPQPPGEISTLKEFRQIILRAEGVIVITGTKPPKAHGPLCDLVTDNRYISNVVLKEGGSARYYWRQSLTEARREFGAVPCKRCGAGVTAPTFPKW